MCLACNDMMAPQHLTQHVCAVRRTQLSRKYRHRHTQTQTHTDTDTHRHTLCVITWQESRRIQSREADLVEGAVLVILGETVLLQEVVLQEACSLQSDLVTFSQGILHRLIRR
jgi:hypothetical protein